MKIVQIRTTMHIPMHVIDSKTGEWTPAIRSDGRLLTEREIQELERPPGDSADESPLARPAYRLVERAFHGPRGVDGQVSGRLR